MNTSFTPDKTLDDLVFENRNHFYGAYFLRKKYDKRLASALAVSLGTFSLILILPSLFKSKELPQKTLETPTSHILSEIEIKALPRLEFPKNTSAPLPRKPNIFNATLVDRPVDTEIPSNTDLSKPVFNIAGATAGSGEPPVDIEIGSIGLGEPTVSKIDTFVVVEKMPEFDGDLSKFLQKNLRYPEAAIRQEIAGRVFLSFVIGADGSISGINVLKGISKECDDEAIRVVGKMPKWKPGKQSGRPVPVRFSLPINFKMNH